MSLTQTKCGQQNITKSLTFHNNCKCEPESHTKNDTFDTINASTAIISFITTSILEASQGSISNISFYYNPETKTTYIQNKNSTLVIKNTGEQNISSISILPNGDVSIGGNMAVIGNLVATNGQFSDTVSAYDANLLGKLNATDGNITNHLRVGNTLTVCDTIETNEIHSVSCDLDIYACDESVVRIPNIKYLVNDRTIVSNEPYFILYPCEIKSFKIFETIINVFLDADSSCHGIEIIIYNNGTINTINVHYFVSTVLITTIPPLSAKTLLFMNIPINPNPNVPLVPVLTLPYNPIWVVV